MDFEWDEAKRDKVLRERNIDFLLLATDLFDGRPVLTKASSWQGEERFVTIGRADGLMYVLVWTWREGLVRIITARRARDGETRQYGALHH